MSLQPPVFGPECFPALYLLWIHGNTGHRAHLNALRLVEMPHALCAFAGVDFINLRPQINRLVRALRLAHIAIDAFIGDHQCHAGYSAINETLQSMPQIIGDSGLTLSFLGMTPPLPVEWLMSCPIQSGDTCF